MSTRAAEFNARVIREFRDSGGRVGGAFEGTPLLLLHHTGAESGATRVNPVGYLRDGGRHVIFASNGGAPRDPIWVGNLRAEPRTSIEVAPRPCSSITAVWEWWLSPGAVAGGWGEAGAKPGVRDRRSEGGQPEGDRGPSVADGPVADPNRPPHTVELARQLVPPPTRPRSSSRSNATSAKLRLDTAAGMTER